MEDTPVTKITVQGYEFDGDADGLTFIQKLNYNEIDTITQLGVKYGGKHYMQDDKGNHFVVTVDNSVYMISKA